MSVADILSSGKQDLHGAQLQVWTKAVQDVGLDLDPYTCKASYVCGMIRQFIETAGLQLRNEYHVGALVSAASATELLGWCCTGATNSKEQPGKRLGNGVQYLEQVGPPYLGPVRDPAAEITGWVRSVRNFGAHGAAYGKHLTLDRMLTVWLLRSLAQALDVFWADDGDQQRHQSFARATITPLYTNGKPIFAHEVQDHLAKGLMPGAKLDHEAGWLPRQPWEDQAPPGAAWRFITVTSPAYPVAGNGSGIARQTVAWAASLHAGASRRQWCAPRSAYRPAPVAGESGLDGRLAASSNGFGPRAGSGGRCRTEARAGCRSHAWGHRRFVYSEITLSFDRSRSQWLGSKGLTLLEMAGRGDWAVRGSELEPSSRRRRPSG